MSEIQKFSQQIRTLIDELKSVCANYGLGNDGNEFKIITQVFLYKFLHDKFVYEIKLLDKKLQNASDWEEQLASYSKDDFEMLRPQVASPWSAGAAEVIERYLKLVAYAAAAATAATAAWQRREVSLAPCAQHPKSLQLRRSCQRRRSQSVRPSACQRRLR